MMRRKELRVKEMRASQGTNWKRMLEPDTETFRLSLDNQELRERMYPTTSSWTIIDLNVEYFFQASGWTLPIDFDLSLNHAEIAAKNRVCHRLVASHIAKMLSGLEADRTRIADLDAQISDLERSLSALREEKNLAQERLDSYKYPVLTLPNEIVSNIFVHFLPAYPEYPPLAGLLSPTLLTHIVAHGEK
ncbi:hypothetical protein B0H13DRAFT_2554411 [Mycena leptocephala]|nr:hypothetical protein B0H13DRAFT_2554411 [Mycena leptocephala]